MAPTAAPNAGGAEAPRRCVLSAKETSSPRCVPAASFLSFIAFIHGGSLPARAMAARCLEAHVAPVALRSPARSGYRMPPDEIRQIVDMPLEPSLSFSPDRKWVLQLNNAEPLPPIAGEASIPDGG